MQKNYSQIQLLASYDLWLGNGTGLFSKKQISKEVR